jgi:hypothetical protein
MPISIRMPINTGTASCIPPIRRATMAPPIDSSREQNGHRLIARFADADARRMALHDRQVVVLELHTDRHQSIAGVDPGPGRRRRWSLPDRVDRPSVATPRRASISVRGRIRSSDPPRRRPAAGTIMRRNGRPRCLLLCSDLDVRFSNVETRISRSHVEVGRPLRRRGAFCPGRTARTANDHRDVISLVGAVTPYPLNSSAMLAVMPFAATMSFFPPLRSPVRSLATPRPYSEDAWRGLYRTADS